MFNVFNLSTLTIGTISNVSLRTYFVVEKSNVVVDEYGVFGLVSYCNSNIGVAFLCHY